MGIEMRLFIVLAAFIMLNACTNPFGNNSSKVDKNHHPGEDLPISTTPVPTPTAQVPGGGDFTGSSGQLIRTPRGYILSQSIGEMASQTRSQTSHGYIMYSDIQGVITSESR